MKIAVGSDHGGFEVKELIIQALQEMGREVESVGCHSLESVDYPDFADKVCRLVQEGSCGRGILVCGTGIGMSIAANRHRDIRRVVFVIYARIGLAPVFIQIADSIIVGVRRRIVAVGVQTVAGFPLRRASRRCPCR